MKKKHLGIAALAVLATPFVMAGPSAYAASEADATTCASTDGCSISGTTVTVANGADIKFNIADATSVTNIINNGTLEITGTGSIISTAGHAITNNGTLTVSSNITVDAQEHGKTTVWNNNIANLNAGTYQRSLENGTTNTYYAVVNHGVMSIADGVSVSGAAGFSSLVENGYYNYNSGNSTTGYVAGVNLPNPELTINGGSFSGGLNTIKNDDGASLVINGGSFANFTQAVVQNNNIATINDGQFDGTGSRDVINNVKYNTGVNAGELTIKGGTFIAGPGTTMINHSGSGSETTIEGGNFNADPSGTGVVFANGMHWDATTGGIIPDTPVVPPAADPEEDDDDDTIETATSEVAELPALGVPNTGLTTQANADAAEGTPTAAITLFTAFAAVFAGFVAYIVRFIKRAE